MPLSKSLLTYFAVIPSIVWFSSTGIGKKTGPDSFLYEKRFNPSEATLLRLRQKSTDVLPFIRKHNFNSRFCFFVDMSIPSGKKRFFVYDISGDSILKQGLVAHGSCDAGFQANPTFSNKVNSGCSATGKYKIGNSYNGNFGLAYKLHGLDSSNNNAFNRSIVLHAYDCVPDEETSPLPLCNSRGCPMVSPGFLDQLKPVISSSSKPILLWIFE